VSVETFSSKYPSDIRLLYRVAVEMFDGSQENGSLVRVLAEDLVRESEEDLRGILIEVNGLMDKIPQSNMPSLDRVITGFVTEGYKDRILAGIAGGIFGRCVGALENAASTGRYDHQEWCDGYNEVIGEYLDRENYAFSYELLPSVNLGNLKNKIEEDGTFSTLFSEDSGLSIFPDRLVEVLQRKQVIPVINRLIVPLWKTRAGFLVGDTLFQID
jgi:hypothetical protein